MDGHYRRWGKRTLDVVVSVGGLALVAPLVGGIGLLIHFTFRQPVFFRQLRPGFHGRPFLLVKLRSMRDASGPDGRPLADAARLTPLGRFLRAWSLDELPTLWNVLRGEMSLVGPRPLLMEYLDRYTAYQARRHEVKPGITGWAQVKGRNALSWEEKFELDVWYVDHWSLWLDLKILAMTVGQIVLGGGISHPGSATMPEFLGHRHGEHRGDEPA